MTKYLSDQNRTVFMYESGTYANYSGTRQWLGLVQTHDVSPNTNVIPIRYQGSTDRNVDAFVEGQQEWEGTINYFPQDWKFLGYAIGSIQDVATGGSFGHIFTEMNSDDHVETVNLVSPGSYPGALHTFTIEDSKNLTSAGVNNFKRIMIGGMVNTYNLTFSQGDVVSAEIGYIAQAGSFCSGTVTAVSPTVAAPYMFNDVVLHIPSGTVVDNAKEITFNVNNNLERGMYLTGSRTLKEILPMNRDYEVTATVDMDNSNAGSFYQNYYVNTGSRTWFNSMIKVDGLTGSLTIVMSGCKMTDMTVPSPLEGTQEQSFTFVPQHVYAVAYDSITKYKAA